MEPDVDLGALTFLIVDDNRFARSIIKSALAAYGIHNTFEASNAVDALKLLKSETIDFALVDQDMPIITGVEFTLLVRRSNGDIPNPALPIILITGHNDAGTVIDARNAGVHEFVVKPLSAETLHRRIHMTVTHPRPFVRTKEYIGPDRRWKKEDPDSGFNRRTEADAGSGRPGGADAGGQKVGRVVPLARSSSTRTPSGRAPLPPWRDARP